MINLFVHLPVPVVVAAAAAAVAELLGTVAVKLILEFVRLLQMHIKRTGTRDEPDRLRAAPRRPHGQNAGYFFFHFISLVYRTDRVKIIIPYTIYRLRPVINPRRRTSGVNRAVRTRRNHPSRTSGPGAPLLTLRMVNFPNFFQSAIDISL